MDSLEVTRKQLARLELRQKETPGFDWHLATRITILKQSIFEGKEICPTCQNQGEIGSPCGRCGRGLSEI